MSYLAIARKYRPNTFDEMVGQAHVTRTLANAIRGGRVHHAFLFSGARGVGKTTAARALARALNCVNGPTPEPCGQCTSCREILAGSSPDLIEIDGASNNGVEDIRELRDTVHYAPTGGKYRIYLIDEVHMLSKAAFNALLKTLEEPPPHVVFIFATTELDKIPDTILSRVQRFDFKRIGQAGVVERLREIATDEKIQISDGGLRLIARAGEGSMRDAQSLLDKVISFAGAEAAIDDAQVAEILGLVDRGLLFEVLSGLVRGEPGRALDAIARINDYGFELSQLTGELLELVRDASFLLLSPDLRHHVELPPEEIVRIEAAVQGADPEALGRLFTALLDVHDQVSKAARPRVVLEMAVARLATVRPAQPISAVLGRLDALERRLRQGGGTPPRSGAGGSGDETPRAGSKPNVSPAKAAPPSVGAAPRAVDARPAVAPPADPRPAVDARPAVAPPAGPRPADPAPARPADPPKVAEPVARERPDRPPASHPDLETLWQRFASDLRAVGGPALSLLQGTQRTADGALTIELPAGRTLAEARRALRLPAVEQSITRHFGLAMRVEALARPGTGTPTDDQQALERELLDDPTVQRFVSTLGAELESVKRDSVELR